MPAPPGRVRFVAGDVCHWRAPHPGRLRSLHEAGKRFRDATRQYFPKTPWGAMGVKAFDFDGDGRVDLFVTDSVRQADVVFPAAGFGERPATTTNLEGRITRLGQKVTPPGTARPDWMIAVDLAARLGDDLGFESLDDIGVRSESAASEAWLTDPPICPMTRSAPAPFCAGVFS